MNHLRRLFSRPRSHPLLSFRFSFFVFPSHAFLLFLSLLLITASCAPAITAITTDSQQPAENFVLVTPNPAATATPFRAPLITALSTSAPVPSATATSTATEAPTDTPAPTDLPAASDTPGSTDQAAPTASPTTAPADNGSPPPAAGDKPAYALNALMDYAGHSLTVSETVIYPNTSGAALGNIVLGVNTNLWSGVFALQSLSVNDQDSSDYTLSGQWLTVNLAAPLQPGQAVKIGIGYRLALPYSSGKFENFGYTSYETNLIDWYPFVVPYQNGSWLLPDPYSYGENLAYPEADFRVSLSFADATAPTVAASAPGSLENGALVYVLPNARNFTISASYQFQMSSANVNGVDVYSYYFAQDANAAAMALQLTQMAINTYSSSFGPYVHSSLTVVETDLNDGLETDGLYFLSRSFYQSYDGSVRNNLSVIAVHETAHQWWYGAVANNQATEPWLDEALATYSEHIFYESNYPTLVNWWWGFRVNSFAPTGWVDSRIYDTPSFRAYVNAVYFNGANFLDSLRKRIGDEAFFAFLQDYYARERGSISSADAFFTILSQHTNVDVSDLVKAYFRYR